VIVDAELVDTRKRLGWWNEWGDWLQGSKLAFVDVVIHRTAMQL
jgi:hypothetical protein